MSARNILGIVIEHAGGSILTCPNGIAFSALHGLSGFISAVPPTALQPWATVFNPAELLPIEGELSLLSGAPAVIYRSNAVTMRLAPDELLRLMAQELRPAEFFALRARYGLFHEIHEDFYDTPSGIALQPIRVDAPGSVH